MEEASNNLNVIRLAFTGPESSGKTTLAKAVSLFFGGKYVPEYARQYLSSLGKTYGKSDLPRIAQSQFDLNASDYGMPLVVCDTEMTVMRIWHLYKYHSRNKLIDRLLRQQRFDHLFLCAPDINWEPDPLREHPNNRELLFELYLQELRNQHTPFSIVRGTREERLDHVKKVILGIAP